MPVTLKDKENKTVTVIGNFVHIDNGKTKPMLFFGISNIQKIQDISELNKNQFHIKLHRKAYIIPTFSKAPVVKDLLKEDQESLCEVSLNSQNLYGNLDHSHYLWVFCMNDPIFLYCFELRYSAWTRNTLLIKNDESFSERICQLEDEVRELKNQIIYKDISFSKAENKISTKLEEIQALQSEIKELEIKYFLAQKDLPKMDSFRQELAQSRQNIELKNIDLDLKEDELNEKKDELM
ncbi:hypothetical protein C1645_864723 [Glomus cerebriforme]|uniref:Uncharacterized protein n=1 Tax=Glomus cerebriforme TaxID=658196 RepID=A0A397SG77_9GLOM|nr:hypothetical protein C1645_864723 [Glomus cerebriforme]